MWTTIVVVNIKRCWLVASRIIKSTGRYSGKTGSNEANHDIKTEGGTNRGRQIRTSCCVVGSPQEIEAEMEGFKTCSFHRTQTRVGKYSWPNTQAINPGRESEPRSCQETKWARYNCLFRYFQTEVWHLRVELVEPKILLYITYHVSVGNRGWFIASEET